MQAVVVPVRNDYTQHRICLHSKVHQELPLQPAHLLLLFAAALHACRLITCDAFAAVRRSYLLRQIARQPLQDDQQQPGSSSTAVGPATAAAGQSTHAGPSTSAAAAAPHAAPVAPDSVSHAAAAFSSLSLSSNTVKTAYLLGVLGHASAGSSSSSSVGLSLSQPHSLTQADKDLISGILGPGGMQLQLQPAGPAAGHLRGVAAAYRAAAAAARGSRCVFRGEVDLARELAALNSSSSTSMHDSSAAAAVRGGAQRQQQQLQRGERQQHAAGASAAGAAGSSSVGSPAAAGRTSFDLDELLTWTTNNM